MGGGHDPTEVSQVMVPPNSIQLGASLQEAGPKEATTLVFLKESLVSWLPGSPGSSGAGGGYVICDSLFSGYPLVN